MKKFVTKLSAFRFNSAKQYTNETVTWYVLDSGNDSTDQSRCFTETELATFIDFAINNPVNFPGGKDTHVCEEEEGPYCGGYAGQVPRNAKRPSVTRPNNVILRKNPTINTLGNIGHCMDVILLDHNGADNHTYNLDFDVIGRIEL